MSNPFIRFILILALIFAFLTFPLPQDTSASPTPADSDAPLGPEDEQGQMYCSFGTNGYGLGSAGAADHWVSATTVYPSTAGANAGKIVALGGYNSHIMVMRFNTDGSLDTTFSGDGIAPIAVLNFEYGYNVALDYNNKIVVAGNGMNSGDGNLVVVRLNTDGSLDTTFSGDGKVNLDIDGIEGYSCGGDCQYFTGIAIQSDNKILVGGQSRYEDYSTVVRLTTAGGLDTTFSGDGILSFALSGPSHSSYVKDLAISDTGEIYMVGGEYVDPVSRAYVAKLTSGGAFDTTFDGDGWKWITINATNTYIADVLLTGDGRLAALATSKDGGASKMQTSIIVMNDDSGALDTTFGGDGIASAHLHKDLSEDSNGRLVRQSDGKFVVTTDTAGGIKGYMALARFNTNGSLDADFGQAGIKRLSLPYASLMGSQSLAVMNDGNLAVLGLVKTGDGFKKFALVKFLTGSMDMTFGFSLALQNTSAVPRGYERDALDLLVCMNGAQNPLEATSFTFNTTGVTDTDDLTSAALYHTTGSVFSNATPVGTAIPSPSGVLNFSQTEPLSGEFNHFWLAYTTATTAPIGNVIDGQATALTVNSVVRNPSITNPAGSRSIFDLLPARAIWTDDWSTSTVKRVDPDGSDIATLLDTYTTGGYGQIGMAIDMTNQFLYFVQSDNTLARTTLDGASLTELLVMADIFNPQTLNNGIAVDPLNNQLYFATDGSGGTIYRANLDASSPVAIATGQNIVTSMAVDTTHSRLYWYETNYTDGNATLKSANLDGSGATTLDTLAGVYGGGLTLDVANNKVYYADGWGYNIKQSDLDGANKSDLIAGLSDAAGAIALDTDNGRLYWLGMDNGSLYSAAVATPGSVTTLVAAGEAYGSSIVFKPQQAAPTVDTPTSADITATGATLGGNVADTGMINVIERGVYWSTTDGFTPPGQGTKVSEAGNWGDTGPFTIAVSGLPSATPIYFKAFAANPAGVGYTNQASFSTGSTGCTGVGSGTVNWTVAFAACPPGAKYIIPAGLNVVLDVDVSLGVDLEVLGTLDATSQMKTFTLTGATAQTLTGNPLTFYKLVVNKTNRTDTVTINGKLQVTKKLTVTKGKLLSASDYGDIEIEVDGELDLTSDITVGGSFTNTGTLTTNAFTVTFDGGVVQNLVANVFTSFYDLAVSEGTTLVEVVTDDNVYVENNLSNSGILRKTQTVTAATQYYFGLAGKRAIDGAISDMEINVTDNTDLPMIRVEQVSGDHSGRTGSAGHGVGWDHYWTIFADGGSYTADVTLPHEVTPESDAKACRFVSGSTWDCRQDAVTANSVTYEGTTEFSDWSVGGLVGPTAVELVSLSGRPLGGFNLPLGVLAALGILAVAVLAGLWKRALIDQGKRGS